MEFLFLLEICGSVLDKAGYYGEKMLLHPLQYAMNFNHMWHLDETPSYEEYLEMEKHGF